MVRWFEFLRVDDIPRMARGNFQLELRHMLFWAMVLGAIEGEGASVVAKKTFNASDLLVTVVWAVPNAVFLLNVLWGVVLRGRARMPMYIAIGAAAVAVLASIVFTPSDQVWGGWLFAAQVGLANFLSSGIVILRTTLWRANYPVTHRARISGRVTTLRSLVTLITVGVLAALFDWNAQLYPYVYLTVAIMGGLSLIPLSRMRVRGERRELSRVRRQLATRRSKGLPGGIYGGLREMVGILRHDRIFATYMIGQFLIGSSNFLVGPLINMKVAGELGFGYLLSATILNLPMVVQMLTIRWWAPYYDRVGLLRFRVVNTVFWTITMAVLSIAMLLLTDMNNRFLGACGLTLLVVGRILHGVCSGGGAIAWNLGHLQYAPEHQTELYMAVHIALTGVRGLVMPFVGYFVHKHLGWGAFVVGLLVAITAHAVFRWVEKLEARLTAAAEAAEKSIAPEVV
jgi:hypothetical protein